MKITFLGSGTSSGVPVPGKKTPVNLSRDPHDTRTRSSILISDETLNIIIDTGPDFRQQVLRENLDFISAVFLTHGHYDHIGGLEDLRAFSHAPQPPIPVYCNEQTRDEMLKRYEYFYIDTGYDNKPRIDLVPLPLEVQNANTSGKAMYMSVRIGNIRIQPVPLIHIPSRDYQCSGYVINESVAYLTDFRSIDPDYLHYLMNLPVLIIGAPLPHPHPHHLSMTEARKLGESLQCRKMYLTHLSDAMFHAEISQSMNPGQGNIFCEPAFDGLTFFI